jgi:dTDP-4-amino-4,6-dideoxygalactose transaminase
MAAILLDIQPGDEVILPSFTFVSSANAFALRGAKIVFIDSQADHPNLDASQLEGLITPKTKAIVVVHYGGLACDMDEIMQIADRHGLFVVEDAAQAVESFYKGKALGAIGHLGCFSFHETKNIQCGEGGMLAINHPDFIKRAEIIWEKGTNRAAFFRGEIDKYGWVDIGSSFLPSEVTAAFLWAQLENLHTIQNRRIRIWSDYHNYLTLKKTPDLLNLSYLDLLHNAGKGLSFSVMKKDQMANAHLFYLHFENLEARTAFAKFLKDHLVLSVFHYQSLHRSQIAQGFFPDQYQRSLPNSDKFSDCLLRLPLFFELGEMSQLVPAI